MDQLMTYAVPAAVVVGGIFIFLFVFGAFGSKKKAPSVITSPLSVQGLDTEGPPSGGTQLLARGTPVRLAVVVAAPAGRGQQLADDQLITILLEELVPGMAQFISRDVPVVDYWPAQLSTQGFVNQFMGNLSLPERGKGNPWSGVAGRVNSEEGAYLVGVATFAARPTSLGEFTAEHEGQWGEIFQVQIPG